ncbi:permease [Croceitalea rosinachiae]|uniref:Permease n=1 Tax=Croceitalea rosinachiae TaxID=3075596 RepID=A0ABU3A8E5_9FLAO|nr:permease [Croceitalea sp. F388]MDT0606457.1 permease [Croceitalea sp. F388]
MDISFQKTIVFLFFIFIGFLLKAKFKSKEEVTGIKKIILNLALPATIFIALLGVQVELNLLLLPLLALALNLLLFLIFPLVLPILGIKKNTSEFRTARLLVPSLAPGLSCFPFVLEFLGEDYLAKAAMADLGNKVFVLVILYLVAMNWYLRTHDKKRKKGVSKTSSMFKVMVSEPVNIFIAMALLLLSFGFNMDSLPFVISETLQKLSLIMTPLVLLFIGLAVKIKRKQFIEIFSLLTLRAGVVFLISGLFVVFTGLQAKNEILLLLAFGLSACSFWPYAHISAVDSLETAAKAKKNTFHNNYAISILALSFPLSTLLILGVLNTGSFIMITSNIFVISATLCAIGLLVPLFSWFRKGIKGQKILNPKIDSARAEHI